MRDPRRITLPKELEGTHVLVTTYHDDAKEKVRMVSCAPEGQEKTYDGPWSLFRESGQLWAERIYKDGGVWTSGESYDRDGQRLDSGQVEAGEGHIRYYHDNDALKSEGAISQGKRQGPWVFFYEDGEKEAEGSFELGRWVGSWRYWDKSGQHIRTDTYQGETLERSYFEGGLLTNKALHRKDAQGRWTLDGPQESYEKGKLRDRTIYEMGASIRRVRNPEPLLEAMRRAGDVRSQLKAMKSAAEGYSLGDYYEGLHQSGELSGDLAAALFLECYDFDLSLRILESYGASALPYLEAEARAQLAQSSPEGHKAVTLSVGLWAAGGRAPLDLDQFGALVQRGLREYASGYLPKPVAALRLLVASHPAEVREALALNRYAPQEWMRGQVILAYAGQAPTDAVIEAVISRVLAFKKTTLRGDPHSVDAAREALVTIGAPAAPKLIEALSGPGQKAPLRSVLVLALAESKAPEGAETLLLFIDDKLEEVQQAARGGLSALGEAALPAIEAALGGKKKKLKAAAAELLGELPPSKATQAVALRCLKKEKDKALKQQLEALAAGEAAPREEAPLPEGKALLVELRAGLTEARRQELLEALQPEKGYSFVDQATRRGIAEARGEAAVVYADRYGQFITREAPEINGLRWESILFSLSTMEGAELLQGWLAAELLVKLEEKGRFNLKYLLEQYTKAAGPHFPEALAWHLATGPAPARKLLLKWLVDLAPSQGTPAFVAAAGDDQKALRALAVDGLVAAGEAGSEALLPMLSGSPREQAVAAEVLRAAPRATAIAPLEAALAGEKKKKAKALLASALLACRLVGGEAIAPAELDASLAAHKVEPASLDQLGGRGALPELRFKPDGPALSEGAMSWLLWAVEQEGPGQPNQELIGVRRLLDDEGCLALSNLILNKIHEDSKNKWVRFQRALLGDDRSMDALGARLSGEAVSYTAFAVQGLEVLLRSGSPSAVRWLDQYATRGRGKLGQEARRAMERLVARQGLSYDDLVDLSTPLKETKKARAELIERLTGAMIGGRTWEPERWRALFRDNPVAAGLAKGLVFAARHGEGRVTLFRVVEGGPLLDLEGGAIDLEGAIGVTLPHPVDVDDDTLWAWLEVVEEQPFEQLGRPFERDADEQLREALPASIATKEMLGGLEKLGYRRGHAQDAGMVYDFLRPLTSAMTLVIEHDGLYAGDGRNPSGPTSKVVGAYLRGDDALCQARRGAAMSEVLADLRRLIPTL